MQPRWPVARVLVVVDLATKPGLRFEDLFAANFADLVVQLNAYTGSLAEAQDAVQEAFCRAWPRWEKLSAYSFALVLSAS